MNITDVAIVTVWFNPTEEQIQHFVTISKYCHVIAVDNSIDNHYREDFNGDITYIPLKHNTGIANAQNEGIAQAKKAVFSYVVFFDQDSIPDIDNIRELRKEFIEISECNSVVAALGPCLINESSGQEYANYRRTAVSYYQEVEMIMSTSTFTSMDVLDKVGYMNSRLFIDFVDHEWCWRARSKGYKIYQTENIKTKHSVGREVIRFMGYERPVSSPFRYYYQFRNSLWLRHCEYAPMGWRRRVIPRLMIEILFLLIHNKAGLFPALKGFLDGIKLSKK